MASCTLIIQVWLLIIDNANAINIARLPEDELAALLLIFWVIRRIYPLSLSISSNVTTFPWQAMSSKESCVIVLMNQTNFTTSTRMFIIVLIYQAIKFIILPLQKAHTKDRTRTIESLPVNDIFLMPTE